MGKIMKSVLRFGNKYSGWHTYSVRHDPTMLAIMRLAAKGFVEVNKFGQFRVIAMPIDKL